MHDTDDEVRVAAADGDADVMAAAAIWARAKARRDRQQAPDPVATAVLGVRRRLAIDGARLLLAWRGGRPVGFALFAPHAATLEVFYLAVDPDAWGGGVGSRLLGAVDDHARAVGLGALELWVLADNHRAVGVYERAGWVATGETHQEPYSDRTARRFLRRLAAGADGSPHRGP